MMKCYKLDPEAFPRNKVMISTLTRCLVLLFSVLGIMIFFDQNKINGFTIMVMVVAFLWISVEAARKNVKLERKRWLFYQLEFTDDRIISKRYDLDDTIIHKDEIGGTLVDENRALYIKSSDENKCISIPVNLIGYEEVKEILSQGISINVKRKKWYDGYLFQIVKTIVVFWIFFGMLASNNKYIVVPIGTLFCIVCLWDSVRIQRSNYVEKGFKSRKKTLLRLMVLLPILAKISKVLGE